MKVSLIIAVYKDVKSLSLIINALKLQTYKNFEVIIAEDDNDKKSFEYISQAQKEMPFSLRHLHQDEDNGFRKNQMLNKAIKKANGEIIVFLDGDSVPHKHFMKEYIKNINEGVAVFGRRVMLCDKLTKNILSTKNFNLLSFKNLVGSKSKRIKYSFYLPFIKSYRDIGIWGCNWGILKKHLVEINGYDEDYIKAGVGEDLDIEWRLKKTGIKLLSIRFGAIVYHLYHKENYSNDDIKYNLALFENKKKAANIYCINGLNEMIVH